jgi:predicted Zn-dependent peptidase
LPTQSAWLAQPGNTAANLAFNLRYDRAFDSYAAQTSLYEKLDTSAVNAALKKYLNPEQLVEVMAGSFE